MGNRISLPAPPVGATPVDERQHWRAEADRHAKERNSFYQRSQVRLASSQSACQPRPHGATRMRAAACSHKTAGL
jgi:hypothetical protein